MTTNLVANLWSGPRLTICTGATALAFPPLDANCGILEGIGESCFCDDEFVLQIVSAGDTNLTAAALYAMRLEPYTFADHTFTTTHASELVNDAAHGFLTGMGPAQLSNSGGALPAGYVAFDPANFYGTAASGRYFLRYNNANSYKLYPTRKDALLGTNVVAITGDGTGTHSISDFTDDDINRTQRVVFAKIADLGDDVAGVQTVVLTAHQAYLDGPFVHQPGTIGYAVAATFSSAVAVNVSAYPRKKVTP